MRNPKIYVLTATPPAALTLGLILVHVRGIPFMEIVAGVAMYALIGIIIAGFVLRLALIGLVVYALYRAVRSRFRKRIRPAV
jgi:hypothetical protein